MVSRVDNDAGTSQVLLPVLLSAFAFPISMLFWIVNVVYSMLTPEAEHLSEGHPMISPWRWLAAVGISILVILWGLRRHSLDLIGAIPGAFGCCNGNTWSLEFGSVIGNSDPFLITMRKSVPRGTNDGVSWIGLFASLLGGLVVGVFHYIAVLLTRFLPQFRIA